MKCKYCDIEVKEPTSGEEKYEQCLSCQQDECESDSAYDAYMDEQIAIAEEAQEAEERMRECDNCYRDPNYSGQYCSGC